MTAAPTTPLATPLAPPAAPASPAIDPTAQLFADVENPALYRQIPNVPIFTTFKASRKDPQTGKVEEIDVDETAIREAVENQQEFEAKRKGLPRITPGHTLKDPKTPEGLQPPPWGWSKSWRFGRFDGKPTIFGTLCLKLEQVPDDSTGQRKYVVPAEEAKTYPYRSPEYYSGRGEITGVALLRRDPQLDLGILALQRNADSTEITLFAAGEVMADMPSNPSSASSASGPSSPSSPGNPSPSGTSPTAPPQASAPSADESEHFMRCFRHCVPHMFAFGEHLRGGGEAHTFKMPSPVPQKVEGEGTPHALSAGAAMATTAPPVPTANTNPATPPGQGPSHLSRDDVQEMLRMEREQNAIRFAKYDQDIAAARQETEVERTKRLEAEKQSLRSRCERRVIQWEAEGIQLNRAEEVGELVNLPDDASRDAYEKKVRKNYRVDLARISETPIPVAETNADGQTAAGAQTEADAEAVERKRQSMQTSLRRPVHFAEAEQAWMANGRK